MRCILSLLSYFFVPESDFAMKHLSEIDKKLLPMHQNSHRLFLPTNRETKHIEVSRDTSWKTRLIRSWQIDCKWGCVQLGWLELPILNRADSKPRRVKFKVQWLDRREIVFKSAVKISEKTTHFVLIYGVIRCRLLPCLKLTSLYLQPLPTILTYHPYLHSLALIPKIPCIKPTIPT